MKIESLRPSFTVYLISSKLEALRAPGEVFSEAGYVCARFQDLSSAFSETFANPPHIVLFEINEAKIDLRQAFQEMKQQLPESHLFLLAPIEMRAKVAEFYSLGLYDVLWTPPITSKEWVRALDRACACDYYMYMNEQLQKGETDKSEMAALMQFHKTLQKRTSTQESLDDFLEFGSKLLGGGALYLRSLPTRKLLSVTQAHQVENWKGLGVDLNEEPGFRMAHLREPQKLLALRDLVKEVFGKTSFYALAIEIAREVHGVAVFLAPSPAPEKIEILDSAREFLQTSTSIFELEKRLHSASIKDDATGVLNRAYFSERMTAEVTRARRSQRPVALLLLAVDGHGVAVDKGGPEEGEAVMRVLARVIEKHSRTNDILARVDSDEFGILLPDTDLEGAAVKAERLRRMIEGGDFSRVLSFTPSITVSMGISEYPSLCRDADELFQGADEALQQIREKTNRVCLAKAPTSFTPDFPLPSRPEQI